MIVACFLSAFLIGAAWSQTTTGATAVARAQQWVDARLQYCQSANGQADGDASCAPVCERTKNPAWDAYRSDCSGLVSWAWGLSPPGQTTSSLPSVAHSISCSSLQPGDALNRAGHHVILFVSWAIQGQKANFIEEPGCSGSVTYAHTFSATTSLSGSSATLGSPHNGQTFQCMRSPYITSAGSAPSAGSNSGSNSPPPPPPSGVSCSFKGNPGTCMQQTACGGTWTSSNAGATGCESQPSNVRCCWKPTVAPPPPPPPPPPANSGNNGNSGNSNSNSNSNTGQSASSNSNSNSNKGAPTCLYKRMVGICTDTCPTGSFRSSSQGANGCQSLPANIKCCLTADQLVDDTSAGWMPSAQPLPIGLIVGVAIGALVLLGAIAAAVIVFVVRRSRVAGGEITYSNTVFADNDQEPKKAGAAFI